MEVYVPRCSFTGRGKKPAKRELKPAHSSRRKRERIVQTGCCAMQPASLLLVDALLLLATCLTSPASMTPSSNSSTTTTATYGEAALVSIVLINREECAGLQHNVRVWSEKDSMLMAAESLAIDPKNHFCSWQVAAPEGKSIKITFQRVEFGVGTPRCAEGKLRANEGVGYAGPLLFDYCEWGLPPDVISDQNLLTLQLSLFAGLGRLRLRLQFQVIPDHERPRLQVNFTSPLTGYLTSPGFDGYSPYPVRVWDNYTFHVQPDHVIMISFQQFDLYSKNNSSSCDSGETDSVSLYELIKSSFPSSSSSSSSSQLVWKKCGLQSIFPQVFQNSIMISFYSDHNLTRTGFKMTFTILTKRLAPQALGPGKFNCSVPHYEQFKMHLHCNLLTECQNGEDEQYCTYNQGNCNGSIAFGDKCYQYFDRSGAITWMDAYRQCQQRGALLASLNTPKEWEAIETALDFGHRASVVFIGLRTADPNLPAFYRKFWQWADDTIAYFVHLKGEQVFPSCAALPWGWDNYSITFPCNESTNADFLCEYRSPRRGEPVAKPSVQFPELPIVAESFEAKNISVMQCPAGHVTRDYLSCDPASYCGEERYLTVCETKLGGRMPQFSCEDGIRTLPFTLVCDHRPDCLDNSDEEFCVHRQCLDSTCKASAECIPYSAWCDGMQHCINGLDEVKCFLQPRPAVSRLPPPAVINLDGYGNFTQQPLGPNQTCPPTHFRCAGETAYCLPVYLRCNKIFDCPDREDEAECEHHTCPGFYRCRNSMVCVHAQHLCDGVFHCPQQDDERLCGLTCPEGCLCQGLAFVCDVPFAAFGYRSLRYLDATGSGMTPALLRDKFYLIHLILASCSLDKLSDMEFPNLRLLDLSDNQIETVDMEIFHGLKNLRVLHLSNNPLTSVTGAVSSFDHLYLMHVDLSVTLLATFDTKPFSNFTNIRSLNLSYTPIDSIGAVAFGETANLEVLDMRGTKLESFPRAMLKQLHGLKTVYAENYRICCKVTLPDEFDINKCFAPTDEISSCEELLRSNVYRFFLWIFATMAIVGNIGCLVYRLFIKEHISQAGFDVLVTNLCVSDFLMGVYLVMIGGADRLYHGNYIWHDSAWKNSAFCQAAGFLSFLSCEMSAFIICLITFDRVLVFRYPFGAVRFRRSSARVACAGAWLAGLTLATLPLLPITSHWQFYSQTGICIPLPITRTIVNGHQYSFAIMIVFNFLLFLLIALGQVLIFLSVRGNSMAKDPIRQTRDLAIARTLTTIVVTDFLCWFPIGLLGILASIGIPIPDEVNVGMAIFVLPVNSALNPFLYTFNTQMERRRRAKEAQMIRCLEKRILTELYNIDDNLARNRRPPSRRDAIDKIRTLVRSQRSFSGSSLDNFSISGRRNGSKKSLSMEGFPMTSSRQEALSTVQDILDRRVLSVDDLSRLLATYQGHGVFRNVHSFPNTRVFSGRGTDDDDVDVVFDLQAASEC